MNFSNRKYAIPPTIEVKTLDITTGAIVRLVPGCMRMSLVNMPAFLKI
jgi:hypothetical protein